MPHQDGLGSVTAITGSNHNIVQRYSYNAFGMPKPTTDFRNPYQFTAREWDKETGLYYYRARYYDPMEGRFISADPAGFEGGINLYSYVENNPINLVDSDGLMASRPQGPPSSSDPCQKQYLKDQEDSYKELVKCMKKCSWGLTSAVKESVL